MLGVVPAAKRRSSPNDPSSRTPPSGPWAVTCNVWPGRVSATCGPRRLLALNTAPGFSLKVSQQMVSPSSTSVATPSRTVCGSVRLALPLERLVIAWLEPGAGFHTVCPIWPRQGKIALNSFRLEL
jgi:hypothetical protein